MGRLQEIKTDWVQEADTYQFRQLAIEPEDIEWLIAQTEKVERYEKALKEVDHIIDNSIHSLTLKRIGEVVSKALISK